MLFLHKKCPLLHPKIAKVDYDESGSWRLPFYYADVLSKNPAVILHSTMASALCIGINIFPTSSQKRDTRNLQHLPEALRECNPSIALKHRPAASSTLA